jgi:hypothetical protein
MTDDAIEKFIKQAKIAKDYNSKEIRISLAEATTLALSLSGFLAQNLALSLKIVELQDRLLNSQTSTPLNSDYNGGSF